MIILLTTTFIKQWSEQRLEVSQFSVTCWSYHITNYLNHLKKRSLLKIGLAIPETIKLLEENIGKTLSDIHHSRILYDPPPRILEIKAKINKWDLIKIKSF